MTQSRIQKPSGPRPPCPVSLRVLATRGVFPAADPVSRTATGPVPRAWHDRPVQQWTVVVPVKGLASAKSRLAEPARNRALALAFAQDTVAAVEAAAGVGRVVVVTGDEEVAGALVPLGALIRPDVRIGGLNAALRSGAAYAVATWGRHPVAALPSDLPALRAEQLAAALVAAGAHRRAFVADADGRGTTLLTAYDGALDPRYGTGSARLHTTAGAVPLAGDWPGLRRDVDTLADLRSAYELGVGPRTTGCASTVDPVCGAHCG